MEIVTCFLSLSKVLMAPEMQGQDLHHKGGDLSSGSVNPTLRVDPRGRVCSVLHNTMGWGALRATNSADIVIATMESWLEPSQKHGQLHFGMNVPLG